MMKKSKMFLSCALCGIMASGMFVGCGEKKIDPTVEDTKNLYIMVVNRGYGVDWLKKIAAKFEEKTGVNVEVTQTSDETKLLSEMRKGPTGTDTDIFFAVNDSHETKYTYENMWDEYPEGLLDLTYLYVNGKVDGEDTTFGNKMIDSFRENINMGTEDAPKYYTSLWSASVMGMTYNIDVLNELFPDGYELPRTSDELEAFAASVKAANGTAFVFPGQSDYFSASMFYPWWAQYEGYERYKNFYLGLAWDEAYEQYILSKDIFNQQGRLEALEAIQNLIDYDKGYYYTNGLSYDNTNFLDLQMMYLTKENKIAMMPNGDWLYNESSFDGACEFGMMKTPVISSITDRLTTVKTEEALRTVIDYVDGDTSVDVSAYDVKDIEEVRIARNMSACLGLSHISYSPAYTNAKTNVYKFYQYLASDEAIKIFKDEVTGGFMPFKSDYSNITTLSKFEQDISSIINDLVYAGSLRMGEIIYKGRVSPIYFTEDQTAPDRYLAAPKSSSTYKTAQELFDRYKYTDSEWKEVLRLIGE